MARGVGGTQKRGPKGPSKYTDEFIDKEAIALIEYVDTCKLIPFEFEFAPLRGYYSDLLSKWAAKNDNFYLALKRLKDIQKQRLVLLGLAGKIDKTMAIFTLKNVAGWRDKKDITSDDKQIDAIKIEIVDGTKS